MAVHGETSVRQVDEPLAIIAEYVDKTVIDSEEAYATACACLADSLGCAILALHYPECTKLLGPVVSKTIVPNGCRVPGTKYILDPIRAAFNIGTMIRWLDFNDTWLAKEWGHPSDNLGGILAVADYLNLTIRDVLTAMIKAYEIQGVLALENSFNQIGYDHVILVKVATCALVTKMLGGNSDQIIDAVSNAFIDVGSLRTYRHAPNTGSRKSWAAGDSTSRGVQLAMMTMQGEMGYPTALSAKRWGLYDVLFQGKPFVIDRPLGYYVIENILFKISFPAEFHAQTAAECAIQLYPKVKDKWDTIESITISTQESAVRIIDKTGPLHNPADRDHCLQYIVAVGLLYGGLTSDHYQDEIAQDPRIDALRQKMTVVENKQYSRDYLDPKKRSISNAISIRFNDGTTLDPVEIEYPIGHRRRRQEALPLLFTKCRNNLLTRYSEDKVDEILEVFSKPTTFEEMSVSRFLSLFQQH